MTNAKTNDEAAALLLQGKVGVFPTDTLYGVVARAADKQAVARLYTLKHREHKPGTVIAANVQQLIDLGVPAAHVRHVEKWWPGSLSVETPLGPELGYLHQDTGRQGFRVVPDERVRAVLEKTGPLLTSSANLPGKEPANTIAEAYAYFGDSVDFYVDGGDRSNSKPSTIARVTDDGIEIIRQGVVVIPPEALRTKPPKPCPFCLQTDQLNGPILHQSDAFYIIRPASAPDAFLIIPTAHTESLTDLPDVWWKEIKTALGQIQNMPESYNVSVNYGRPAGQTIKHLHFWIVPRADNKPSSGKGLATLVKHIDSAA